MSQSHGLRDPRTVYEERKQIDTVERTNRMAARGQMLFEDDPRWEVERRRKDGLHVSQTAELAAYVSGELGRRGKGGAWSVRGSHVLQQPW
eukprot:CAMPEP_0113821152 /NCGR_PEP_ID=MMETSP0328-20130328/1595_1 /TAXON_ID=39455 /ORGANISM="Alexandrium minutum" /LENGTH=90 /DNA_ID=CAMNT_0000789083 /DNA_START=65 /DNA_END=334 /DNA_ORIENTATION=+ /assembly_acc=CAM_ASM_000350